VDGLAASVAVNNPESTIDHLDVNTLPGDDTVRVSGGAQDLIRLFVDGWSF
jgi:hypothetical protein